MRPGLMIAAIAIAALALGSSRASAQITGYRGPSLNPASRYLQQGRPRVSPYLNLLQNNGGLFGQPNYQTLVRPLVQQNRLNNQAGQAIRSLQGQVNSITSANSGQNPYGPGGLAPTGRTTGGAGLSGYFGNLGHYFPAGAYAGARLR